MRKSSFILNLSTVFPTICPHPWRIGVEQLWKSCGKQRYNLRKEIVKNTEKIKKLPQEWDSFYDAFD